MWLDRSRHVLGTKHHTVLCPFLGCKAHFQHRWLVDCWVRDVFHLDSERIYGWSRWHCHSPAFKLTMSEKLEKTTKSIGDESKWMTRNWKKKRKKVLWKRSGRYNSSKAALGLSQLWTPMISGLCGVLQNRNNTSWLLLTKSTPPPPPSLPKGTRSAFYSSSPYLRQVLLNPFLQH